MAWNKLKSLFVESGTSKDAASAAMAELEKYQVPENTPPGAAATALAVGAVSSDGALDFQALYDRAGIPNTDEVEALERFLHGLDEALPQPARLAAAKAFLGAIGKAPADVVQDAGRKIAVVRAVVDAKRSDVEKSQAEHQTAMAELERQIDEHRAAVAALKQDLEAVRGQCATEEGRLQGARVFFGAVGDVKPGAAG
jgi:hypothetical protein